MEEQPRSRGGHHPRMPAGALGQSGLAEQVPPAPRDGGPALPPRPSCSAPSSSQAPNPGERTLGL